MSARETLSVCLGLALAGLALAGPPGVRPLRSQEVVAPEGFVPNPFAFTALADPVLGEGDEGPTSARPVLASALVPGAGQWMLGQRRWLAYLALEAASILYHLERDGRGRSLRGRYRDLAWEVARSPSGPRVDGDFDYYERLSNFTTSGRFDTDRELSGIQPESNAATYNGRIWDLARGLFLGGNQTPQPGDPGWDQAIAYYTENGYGEAFLWDWTNQDGPFGEYRATLRESDDAFRRATTVLGVVIGNHIVSAVDALLSSGSGLSQRVDLQILPARGGLPVVGPTWDVAVRLYRE